MEANRWHSGRKAPPLPVAGGLELMAPEPPDLPPARRQELESLAQRLDQRFQNLGLLDQALRHSSYAHDNPGSGPSNERLEFLGDAVLALTVSALLLVRFPDLSLIHISEPTRLGMISYAVLCLKKKKT